MNVTNSNPIFVTGTAGFIGFHLAVRLLEEGKQVVGLDNFNNYYDVRLKSKRNEILHSYSGFTLYKGDLSDVQLVEKIFETYPFHFVVNLAAQAGVRYSLVNPFAYTESNITGFVNLLENCRKKQIKHVVFASSSSVYGANRQLPFSEHNSTEHPVSLYAATKKANELLAHSYAHNFDLPVTGLRFFTVYGPWGRPDMALFLFTKAILEGEPIQVFNEGNMIRDFTYVGDIIESLYRLIDKPPIKNNKWDSLNPDPSYSYAPYRIFNIGNNQPVQLLDFVSAIEKELGKKAEIHFRPLQPGDVPSTFADTTELENYIDYRPNTSIAFGIHQFIKWYKEFYNILD